MSTPRYKWQPTTAEIAKRFGLRPEHVVRFDHNTSPFATDWAPGLVAPMARQLNEYPGASYADLRKAAAAHFGVEAASIVPGAIRYLTVTHYMHSLMPHESFQGTLAGLVGQRSSIPEAIAALLLIGTATHAVAIWLFSRKEL